MSATNAIGTAADTTYALRLSDAERTRYRAMAARAVEDEGERWRRAGVVAGARVVDIGCGPGAVLLELARMVTDGGGEAVGVEPDATARAAARQELDSAGFGRVRVVEGTGDATGLEAGSWDCVMLRHVLYHTGAAAPRIVAHAAGLLRPGGHLYVVDSHADCFLVSPSDVNMEGQLRRYSDFQSTRGNNVRIGPEVGAIMRGAGLEAVETAGWFSVVPAALLALGGPMLAASEAMLAAGMLSAEEAERWDIERRRFADIPGAALWAPLFLTVGRASVPTRS
jgi:SAM-dependent methyltransferase